MDTLRTLARLLVAFAICQGFTDGLIGLRPPDQLPREEPDKKPPRPVSPKPSQLHRPQLYATDDHPDAIQNATVIETKIKGEGDKCQTSAILRCSSQLLRHSLINDKDVCRDIKQFTNCILRPLEQYGRREFIVGMIMLDNLHFAATKTFRCLSKDSSIAHLRHRIAKRNGGICCTEGVLGCAIQTFFEMSTNRGESCNLVNFYDVCMKEVFKSCQSKSLATSYTVFVLQMKRQCKSTIKRSDRSKKLRHIFTALT